MDYEKACKQAATDQGLDPLMEELTGHGLVWSLEQTGGFCMAVTVPAEGGTWAIVNDGQWCLGFYEGDDWLRGEEHSAERETPEVKDVPSIVSARPA